MFSPPAKPVEKGATVAVVAPSGPFDLESFEAGLAWLRTRYEVRVDEEDIKSRHGFLAGPDGRRLRELRDAIMDPEVSAIIAARGGYGATRLLPDLDMGRVADANKLIVGFSDITALHALWARAGVRSIHAPMVTGLGKASDAAREHWAGVLEGTVTPGPWDVEMISGGEAEGPLLGGNLAVLGALLGTPYELPVDGAILLLEDVGERPYRLDRLLTSLHHATWLERCAGVVLGGFTEGKPGPDGVTPEQVLEERLGHLGVPVARGLPVGHMDENEPILLGVKARLTNGTLELHP